LVGSLLFNFIKINPLFFFFRLTFIADNLFWMMLSFGMWNATWRRERRSSLSSPRFPVWKDRVREILLF
jgi:hypothetical protein